MGLQKKREREKEQIMQLVAALQKNTGMLQQTLRFLGSIITSEGGSLFLSKAELDDAPQFQDINLDVQPTPDGGLMLRLLTKEQLAARQEKTIEINQPPAAANPGLKLVEKADDEEVVQRRPTRKPLEVES